MNLLQKNYNKISLLKQGKVYRYYKHFFTEAHCLLNNNERIKLLEHNDILLILEYDIKSYAYKILVNDMIGYVRFLTTYFVREIC